MNMPVRELEYLLKRSASKETSSNAERWIPENPFYSHCFVVAAIVQDLRGGIIQRIALPEEWHERLGFKTHYVNRMPDGMLIDLSRSQFPVDFPYDELIVAQATGEDKRIYGLDPKFPQTIARFEMLLGRFQKERDSNPLFTDAKFQLCWEAAFSGESVCPKMRFACVVYADGGECLVATTTNRLMTKEFGKPRFCALDGSACVRTGVQSRIDALIGDCGHAPIWALRSVFDLGYSPHDLPLLDFYETGFNPDGSPWWRKELDYTCLYCENLFAMFGLGEIWVPYEGDWHTALTRDSFYSAPDYALGKKKV